MEPAAATAMPTAAEELGLKLLLPLYVATMLLVPAASEAVEKVAVPLPSAALSSTLPLLTSVKVTDPAGTPPLAPT